MIVDEWMEHARSCIDGDKAGPKRLLLLWQGILCSSLMSKARVTSILRHADDVVTDVGKHSHFEGSIIVPLGTYAKNAHIWIVAQTKNVPIWCLWVYAMGAVNVPPTPEFARSTLLLP